MMPTVSVYTSYGTEKKIPYSDVEIGNISICRFSGDNHQEKATSMANELNAIMQKYGVLEEG